MIKYATLATHRTLVLPKKRTGKCNTGAGFGLIMILTFLSIHLCLTSVFGSLAHSVDKEYQNCYRNTKLRHFGYFTT